MVSAAQLSTFSVNIATRGQNEGSVAALAGVDLDVAAGHVTALVGESGCGKSLVALALCGLLPPGSSTTGEVQIAGTPVACSDERRWQRIRGRIVGLVPQSAATSFTPVRTLGSQLREAIAALDGTSSPGELLSRAGLPRDALNLFPHQLSGGMAQRAAIAAALAGAPRLVVADEPTSALDPELSDHVWTLLRGIADDGNAVLVVTHEIKSLTRSGICDSIAVMRAGRVVAQHSPAVMAAADGYIARLFEGVRG